MSQSYSYAQKIGNVRPLNPCPSLDIDFVNGGYVNDGGFANQASVGSANFNIGAFNGPDPVFSRANAATFRGSNGLVQYAPENLLLRSEEFNDSSWWSKISIYTTGMANTAVAPNGAQTADSLMESGVTGVFAVNTTVSSLQGSVYTFSVYAKKNQRSVLQFLFQDGQTSDYANFDLDLGVISGGSYSSASIIPVGNGWFRCSITVSISGTTVIPYIKICNSPTMARYGSYAGILGHGIYIWGAQLERGSIARPYISTTSAARYGPRFEYDTSGNPLGLLMEEQSTNLLSYSEQFDNAAWARTGIKAFGSGSTANAATSPNGATTADLIVEDTSTGNHFLNFSCVMGALPHTISCYMKSATATTGSIFITQSGNVGAVFDLSTGQVVSVTGTGNTASISNAGNGWYLCSVTNNGSSDIFDNVRIGPRTGAISSYLGDGTSGIYIWGAQLEQKPFATSYMPTVGGTMTRNADVVTSTIGTWFNVDEGTVVVGADRFSNQPDSLFEFTSGTTACLTHIGGNATVEEIFAAEDSAVTIPSSAGGGIGTEFNFGASYFLVTGDMEVTVDGDAPNNTGAGSLLSLTTPTTLNIGYSPEVGKYWNGHINSFRYYPKSLPNKLSLFTA